MKTAIVSGIFAAIAAILAALAPLVWTEFDKPGPKVLYSNIIQTEVGQSLVIAQLANLELKSLTKKMKVIQIINRDSVAVDNMKIEFKLNTDWANIGTGTRVSRDFFTSDLALEPSGQSSFVARISRFPADSSIEIFLLSDNEFSVVSITSDRDDVQVSDVMDIVSRRDRDRSWIWVSLIFAGAAILLATIAFFKFTNRRIKLNVERA